MGAHTETGPIDNRGTLSPSEWTVLGLLCISPAHRWTLARELKSGQGLGAIWPLSTPLVYPPSGRSRGDAWSRRSASNAESAVLAERCSGQPGLGQPRFRRWLREPVEQAAHMESLILLKLVLAERAGITPPPIVKAQREAFTAEIESLEAALHENSGIEPVAGKLRIESTRAVRRFIENFDGESGGRPRLAASA